MVAPNLESQPSGGRGRQVAGSSKSAWSHKQVAGQLGEKGDTVSTGQKQSINRKRKEVNEWIDGWMDGWVDRWMDGWRCW